MQLIQFIFGIAVLIFFHEMGHFLFARLFKVEVEEFGIGFPPRIATLFEAGGTTFSLNWIPLGGFVRIKGENDPEIPGGLAAASPWVRLVVIAAGSLTNILIGVLLAGILYFNIGEPIPNKVKILEVAPNSPAETSGLIAGDIIIKVAGQSLENVNDLHNLIYDRLGESITITIERGDQVEKITLIPRENPPENEGAIGIVMGEATQPTTITRAFYKGAVASYNYIQTLLLLPVHIAKGNISAEEARPVGYKGMYDIYQQTSNPPWFFMMISLSLGLFNLLPIPALDGGRLFLILPEILLQRRVPPRYESIIHMVGFAVLLLLLIYVNLQDFINPIQLPK
ncbi:MAG: site-2 protease family protein [Anaerolineales bacterium]|nr:site-2 protease family protein [Anaerolineales bacterium]